MRILGVALDSLHLARTYHRAHDLNSESVALPDPRAKNAYRFHVIPQTLVLDREGRVVRSRPGLLEPGPALDSIAEAIRDVTSLDPGM